MEQNQIDQQIIKKDVTSRKGLFIFLGFVIVALVIGIMKLFTMCTQGTRSFSSDEYIAVVYIEGIIEPINDSYDHQWAIDTIYSLSTDPDNKGILLYIDSPGGAVYQSDELYLELMEYKAETDRPIFAYLGPQATSGGYYIACAADYIYANRNSITGSIGVISGQSVDLSKFLETHGIKINTFYAGKNKDMLGIDTPVTPEQEEIMQKIADECYQQFTGIVAESRQLPLEQVIELSDGRIYTAQQALENGLIDEISRFSHVETTLSEEYGAELFYLYPEIEKSFYDYLLGTFSNNKKPESINTLDSILEITGSNIPFPAFMYQEGIIIP